MRNLLEYPITFDEEVKILIEIRDGFLSEGRMGDMRPLIIHRAIDRLVKENIKQETENG